MNMNMEEIKVGDRVRIKSDGKVVTVDCIAEKSKEIYFNVNGVRYWVRPDEIESCTEPSEKTSEATQKSPSEDEVLLAVATRLAVGMLASGEKKRIVSRSIELAKSLMANCKKK